jgi:hypothetical protein
MLKTIEDIMYIVDGINTGNGLGYKPTKYNMVGGSIEDDIKNINDLKKLTEYEMYDIENNNELNDEEKRIYIDMIRQKELDLLGIEDRYNYSFSINNNNYNEIKELNNYIEEEEEDNNIEDYKTIYKYLMNKKILSNSEKKLLDYIKKNYSYITKNMIGGTITNEGDIIGLDTSELEELSYKELDELISENYKLLEDMENVNLSDEGKWEKKQLENETLYIEKLLENENKGELLKDKHDKQTLSDIFGKFKKYSEMSKEFNKNRLEEIKNINETKKSGFGKAYEHYTKKHKNDERYKDFLDEDFKNIIYEPNNEWSVYDGYYKKYDNNGNLISENIIEDKNYNTLKSKKVDGYSISLKDMKNYQKNNFQSYDDMKDVLKGYIKEFAITNDDDKIEYIDEQISNIKNNSGVKIQFTKFEGQRKGEEPLITKDRKVWGIYNNKNDKILKENMNGDINIKLLAKEGEFLYNPLKDENIKLKPSRKIKGVQYYNMDASYYINDNDNNININRGYVYIPPSKFNKKILNI